MEEFGYRSEREVWSNQRLFTIEVNIYEEQLGQLKKQSDSPPIRALTDVRRQNDSARRTPWETSEKKTRKYLTVQKMLLKLPMMINMGMSRMFFQMILFFGDEIRERRSGQKQNPKSVPEENQEALALQSVVLRILMPIHGSAQEALYILEAEYASSCGNWRNS